MQEVREVPSRPRTSAFSQRAAQFSARVRAAREAKGWSQLDLAERTGISYRQIQNIEGNKNNERGSNDHPQPANPKLDTVFLLAQTLEVSIGDLTDPETDP